MNDTTQAMKYRAFVIAVALLAPACGDPEIVVPEVMGIVALFPGHGQIDVDPEVEVLAYFSHRASSEAEVTSAVSLACAGAPPCSEPNPTGCASSGAVSATVTYDPAGQLARLTPDAELESSRCYVVTIGSGLAAADDNVAPLPVDVRASFLTD